MRRASAPGSAAPETAGLTFPRRLFALAAARPTAVAMQEKRYGIWHPIAWAEYAAHVRDVAHGLATLGVARGDVVGVIGDNRPEWLIAEIAAQCLGAAVVGLDPTSDGDEIVHILERGRVRVVIAEDQEQVDKLVRLDKRLARVAHIVYCDPRGLEHETGDRLARFGDLAAAGRRLAEARPGWLDGEIAAGDAGETAVICASGTAERPRLARLSHRGLFAVAERLHQIDPLDEGQRHVSFLPLPWIGEQLLCVACGLARGLTVAFPEEAATERADLREIGPDVMLGPPRVWESLRSTVQAGIDDAGWLKRRVFGWAYGVGDAVARRRARGLAPGPWLAAAHGLAELVGLAPVRDRLGLSRLRHGYAGAPLAPEVLRFFHALGVPLKPIWGGAEVSGLAVCPRDGDVRLHTVGTPLPGTELRIADDGEILVRSPGLFAGYVGEDVTAGAPGVSDGVSDNVIDGQGWLHTGDTGYLEDDHLVVTDRREIRGGSDERAAAEPGP